MKKILVTLIVMLFIPMFAIAGTYAESTNAEFGLNRGTGALQKYQVGSKLMRETMHDAKVSYSFADQGGATGTYNLHDTKTFSPKLPNNAIVVGCYIDVITTPVGSGSIALSTGKAAGDLLGTTTATSITGIYACIPTGTAATSIKLTADVTPTIVISSAALTAGKFNVHILYLLSPYP